MGSGRGDIGSPTARRKSVAILVNNACTYDSRVIKGAEALAQRGYRVGIFAVADKDLPALGKVRGVMYRRLPRRPDELPTIVAHPKTVAVDQSLQVNFLRKQVAEFKEDLTDALRLAAVLAFGQWLIRLAAAQAALRRRVRSSAVSNARRVVSRIRRLDPRPNGRITVRGTTPTDLVSNTADKANLASVSEKEADPAYQLVGTVRRRYQYAVEAFQPDIIHCHDADCLASAYQLSEALGCPYIYDVHELCAHRWDRSDSGFRESIAAIERTYIAKAAGIATVSEELADELFNAYGRRALVIYNSPRFEKIPSFERDLRSDLNLPEDVPLGVYTGVLAVTRGLDRFIKAMQSATDVHFALVGKQTPELIEQFTQFSRELGVADRVHFVPAVPFDAVSSYISSASFGVIPAVARTKNQKVGLPNKLFEMMFAGLPILIGDIPQRRRVLEQYGEGVFFPDQEDVDLAPYVADIAAKTRNPLFREVCRRKSERAATSIGWLSQMDRLYDLYDQILGASVNQPATTPAAPLHDRPFARLQASS